MSKAVPLLVDKIMVQVNDHAGANNTLSVADYIVIENVPYAVFEWIFYEDGQYPKVKVQLNPARIQKLGGGYPASLMYRDPIADPRTVS